ncbi:MAG: CvpA family protein [Desulfuromonadaceae bacterium]|nr:CvpA family protein [Desulfuromonadaceae bacterium]
MNLLDSGILVILAAFLAKGLLRGVLKEICSLLGLVGGALLAYHYHPPLAELVGELLALSPQMATAVAFVTIFSTAMLLFSVFGSVFSKLIRLLFLGGANRVLGGFFGLTQGVVLLAMVLYALTLKPAPQPVPEMLKASQLAPPFIELGGKMFAHGRSAVRNNALIKNT